MRERGAWGEECLPFSEGKYTHARRNSPRECRPSTERYGDRETALSTPAGPRRHASAGADCGEPLAGDSGQARGALRSATGETTHPSFHDWWYTTPQDKDVEPSPIPWYWWRVFPRAFPGAGGGAQRAGACLNTCHMSEGSRRRAWPVRRGVRPMMGSAAPGPCGGNIRQESHGTSRTCELLLSCVRSGATKPPCPTR